MRPPARIAPTPVPKDSASEHDCSVTGTVCVEGCVPEQMKDVLGFKFPLGARLVHKGRSPGEPSFRPTVLFVIRRVLIQTADGLERQYQCRLLTAWGEAPQQEISFLENELEPAPVLPDDAPAECAGAPTG